jgi:chemotaxis protein CheX
MKKILGIDFSPKAEIALLKMMVKDAYIQYEKFHDDLDIRDNDMIILWMEDRHEQIDQKICKLRYACKFQNIPIILMHEQNRDIASQPFIIAGATEVLSFADSAAACRNIINGYLIPGREPLPEEKEYLDPFIRNTRHILKTMAGIDAEFKKVYFSNTIRIFGDVSGIMGLSGISEGTLAVTFYWDLAKTIIAKMMSTEEDLIDAELIHDGVSEIINMISGTTKKDFVGKPYHFEITLPSVIVGPGHQIGYFQNTTAAVLIFEVDGQSFALHVCIKPKTAAV